MEGTRPTSEHEPFDASCFAPPLSPSSFSHDAAAARPPSKLSPFDLTEASLGTKTDCELPFRSFHRPSGRASRLLFSPLLYPSSFLSRSAKLAATQKKRVATMKKNGTYVLTSFPLPSNFPPRTRQADRHLFFLARRPSHKVAKPKPPNCGGSGG